jgi:hypothetical protein
MQPGSRIAAAFCVLAVSGSLCAFAAPSAFAKTQPTVAEKSGGGKSHVVVAAKKKKKAVTKTRKSKAAVKRAPATKPEPRTPTDKQDCIAVAQAFYREAGRLSKKTNQDTPKGFVRVISKLSELCGEEEFDKARVSLDWMDACLQDLAGKQQAKLCSSHESLLCTLDPQSKSCLASGRVAEH